jgi:hypothetical protein
MKPRGKIVKGQHEVQPHPAQGASPARRTSAPPRLAPALLAPVLLASIAVASALLTTAAHAETCTTQSGLQTPERDAIASVARSLATFVQQNNTAALQAAAVGVVARDFSAMQYLVGSTAPRLAGDVPIVDQVYLLDATTIAKNPDGSATDAQFYCSLNRSTMEVEFVIPALPPGKYAFAIVNLQPAPDAPKAIPYRLSFLLRQEAPSAPAAQSQANPPQARWMLAGFYPRATTAAGHDGLWYWTQARQMAANKQPWNAWLYYQAAAKLLQPADFVLSTHLDKLRTEAAAAAPPALSEGVSVDAPLVVKGADGTEYHFTGLGVNDSLGPSSLDVEAHLRVDAGADPAAARKRNNAAASALLAAYPELRKAFHGVWIYAETPGQNPFATEEPMVDIK